MKLRSSTSGINLGDHAEFRIGVGAGELGRYWRHDGFE
jgi:hypothetical protein